ncbi:hypothetical protein ACQKWADRAFT_310680 [Trichoderma austrokoningii]
MARGRSVPPRASQRESPPGSDNGYDNSKSLITAIIPSPAISPIITTRPKSKLVHNAEALARMTIELNVRTMATQTAGLEKALRALMMRRKEDKEFLDNNNARVQRMVQEMQVVKQRMEEIQSPGWKGKGSNDLEQCKKDMHDIIGELKRDMKKEMSDLKGRVGDLSDTLDKLPTVEEAKALISRTRVARSTVKKSGKVKVKPDDRAVPPKTIKQRIEDAISSTRRWNHDHKITKLKDAAFIANYLKQQSKRDAQMAVYIQKAVQRHVYHSGRARSKTRPKNLEQFCQMLVWKDVLDAVKDVLVDNRGQIARAFGK